MKIYVASSWRNEHQQEVVDFLRRRGLEVYDFRNPRAGGPEDAAGGALDRGFAWSEIDPDWSGWDPVRYRNCLRHPLAQLGFAQDKAALDWCEACLLVQPCGRSAHLELGYACGIGKRTAIYYPPGVTVEPELMNLLAGRILILPTELSHWATTGWASNERRRADRNA